MKKFEEIQTMSIGEITSELYKSGAFINKAIVADYVVIDGSRRENEEGLEVVLLSK